MKLGIALSGGGIRGIAHAGVLKALEENNIEISAIGGTSSGSIIAMLYALGYSPYYIYILFKRYAKDIVNQNSFSTIKNLGTMLFSKNSHFAGFNSGEELEKNFNEIALKKGIKKISDIRIPIVIPAVDIKEAKEYVFTNNIPKKAQDKTQYITDITVGKAVRASSSFPVAFSPCEFENHEFLDGGILDNFPTTEVKKQGVDRVLTVNFKADDINKDSNVMDLVMRTVDIMGNKISEENLEKSDMILTIQTDKTGLVETSKIDDCYKYGYRQTINNISKIKDLINNS